MAFKSDHILLLFKVNNRNESEMVQEELFNHGFRWMSRGRRYVDVLEYPSYIFANMLTVFDENKKLSYYNTDENSDINNYLEKNYDFYDYRIFDAKDVKQLNTILKYGTIRPSYAPKKIERFYESNSDGYDFLFFKVENIKDFEKIRDYLINKNYLTHDRDKDKIYNMTNDNFPNYLIIDRENTIFALSEWNKEWDDEDVLDYINYINNDTHKKILNKLLTVNDIKNIDIIFKGIILPSYQPKKIERVYESSSINNMFVHTDGYNNALELQDYLQSMGYAWHGRQEIDVIQEYQNRDVYIFRINIINKDIEYVSFYYEQSFISSTNFLILFYPKDILTIKNIIKFNENKPSYKPRIINKFESIINESNGIDINEICIKIDDEIEFSIMKKIINEINYSYSSGPPVEYPHYLFLPLNNQYVSHVRKEDEYVLDYPDNHPDYLLDGVYDKILTIRDLPIIKIALKYKNIKYLMPSYLYKPKKIER